MRQGLIVKAIELSQEIRIARLLDLSSQSTALELIQAPIERNTNPELS
ncbi:hypothetical protein MGMO_94c00070 [Methyloglobulus morosus KoM1]|uniref:Uncharacterized protein n=1 Tax=Methyloglobulus morosus KoM1 TaxID=1116472 RepID=V5BZE2_9GAMM|nr:hypothetical protein MGMO_94c00070 [Methyloglobulus morosus KoM1]